MLKIKPIKQTPGFCGPTSLKMVLDYFNVTVDIHELGRMMRCTVEKGTALKSFERVAQFFGLKYYFKDNANISDIKKFLHKKIPVIVNWFSTDEGHYSVVVKVNEEIIYLQDPELGAIRKMKIADFKRVWFDFPNKFIRTPKDLRLRRLIVVYPHS